MNSIKEIDDRKRELQQQLDELENAKRILQEELDGADGDAKSLAIVLHNSLCTSNHTDMCGWHYEIKNRRHDWSDGTHKDYLEYAKRLIKNCEDANMNISVNDICVLVELINKSKYACA